MTGTISSDPGTIQGKSSDYQTELKRGREYLHTLPYEARRVRIDCHHSPLYILKLYEDQPLFCGLCLLRQGFESEIPSRIHQYRTLAQNGNPESTPKFVAHLVLAMGLVPPKPDESLSAWRRKRESLAREQYTARSPLDHRLIQLQRVEKYSAPSRLFPVASALWKLMGYQPPLGRVLVPAVGGRSEIEIAGMLQISYWDTHVRMAKGIRTVMGFLPDAPNTNSDAELPLLSAQDPDGSDLPGFPEDVLLP